MATSDVVTEKFNEEILIDLLQEVCREIDCAVSQYDLMQSKLRHITLRLDRALRTERLSSVASLELQRDSIQGVMCMYGEYLERKLHKHNQIQRYRQEECTY